MISTFTQPINNLFVCQDGSEGWAPVDRHLRLFGQSLFVKLQKDPLGPLDVIRIGRRQLLIPIIRKAQHLELSLEVGNVLFGSFGWLGTCLHSKLFSWQSEGVPSDWMEDVVSCHSPIAGHYIGSCHNDSTTRKIRDEKILSRTSRQRLPQKYLDRAIVARRKRPNDLLTCVSFWVTDVKSSAGRVWEHIQDIFFWFGCITFWCFESLVFFPEGLPLGFDVGEWIFCACRSSLSRIRRRGKQAKVQRISRHA